MKTQQGVTLLELMIVVAVISILAAIAYPSYQSQLLRSHRAEAKTELLKIQVAQEKYFLANNGYATALTALGYGSATPNTTNNYYQLSLSNNTSSTFTATATALSGQLSDTSCKTLSVAHTGERTATNSTGAANNTECWQR